MISVKTASGADNVTISSDEYNSMKSQISSLQDEVTKLNSNIDTFTEQVGETVEVVVRNPDVISLLDDVDLAENMSISSSGVETTSSNYKTTDYIPCSYNDYLTYYRSQVNVYDGIGLVALYDSNKNFLKRYDVQDGTVYTSRITYSNAAYVRFCIGRNADLTKLVVTTGSTYEESLFNYNSAFITESQVVDGEGLQVTNIKDGVVTPEKTNFVTKSKNVLNIEGLQSGLLGTDGTVTPSNYYLYTVKCPVTGGATLLFRGGDTYQGVRRIVFYNGDTILSGLSYGGYANYIRTASVPSAATHAVFCIGRATFEYMVIEGDNYPDYYESFGSYRLKPDHFSQPESYLRNRNILINPGIPCGWCETKVGSDSLAYGELMAYSSYVNKLTALSENNSDYLTMTTLGNDSSGSYVIYRIDLSPGTDRSYQKKNIPTIAISASLHGQESASAYAVLCLIEDLCGHYLDSPYLNYLRNNVRFVIIPVANPYGFENGIYKNANGVNINRNFSYGFADNSYSSSDNGYGGTTANSEAETQYVKQMIDKNLDALCYLDIHSNNDAYGNGSFKYVNWLSMSSDIQSDLLENAAINQINGLTYRLNELGKANPSSGDCGYVGHTSGQGMAKSYAAHQGLLALTCECTMRLPNDTLLSEDTQRINAEIVENLIIHILRAYATDR